MTHVDRRFVWIVLAVLSSSIAHAQSPEAETLFREGRSLIKQGKLEEGCDKLAASDRLESSIGTLLNLGDCRERLGQHATAWAAFRKAEAMARRKGSDEKREREAKKRAIQLEPKLSNLSIAVPHPVEGVVVRRDSTLLDPAQWNSAVPVDPGTYTIIAEAPGYLPWKAEIRVDPRSRNQVVTVPELGLAPAPHATAVVARVEPSRWTALRQVSAGAAAIAIAAVGVGVYSGIRADDLRTRADALCPLDTCTDPVALRLNHDARSAAARANASYAGAALAAAASAVLWYAGAPRRVAVAPDIRNGGAGLAFVGAF